MLEADMKRLTILFIATLILSACAPAGTETMDPNTPIDSGSTPEQPFETPIQPQLGDGNMQRGNVFINASSLLIRESYPPQIAIDLSGDLPTPCHQLRVEVADPDADNKIMVDVYTVVDPNTICIQVLKPFGEIVELGTFPTGHYSVWVNGEMIGEFDS
jgi:hypothetical protein